ncbi:unnamed protein product, partial [Iphiclides podalirius]
MSANKYIGDVRRPRSSGTSAHRPDDSETALGRCLREWIKNEQRRAMCGRRCPQFPQPFQTSPPLLSEND